MKMPRHLPENRKINHSTLKRTINEIINYVKSNTLSSSEDFTISRTVSGTSISRVSKRRNLPGGGGGSGSGTVIIKITSRSNLDTYIADVYGSGKDQDATDTNVIVKVLDIEIGDVIPNDTYWLAVKQPWTTGETTTSEYTINNPRWLS
jgi:hypothetical protein